MLELPLTAFCDGDICVFSSKENAESYMEPIDVENEEWTVFDAAGNKLGIHVAIHPSRIGIFVTESVEITEPNLPNLDDKNELRQLLTASIRNLTNKERNKHGFPVSDVALSSIPIEQLFLQVQKAFLKY